MPVTCLQGDLDAASSSFSAAQQALGGSSSSSSSDSKVLSFEVDPGSCLSSRLQQEVAADVALGASQVGAAAADHSCSLVVCMWHAAYVHASVTGLPVDLHTCR
jgi:hypothetical protein